MLFTILRSEWIKRCLSPFSHWSQIVISSHPWNVTLSVKQKNTQWCIMHLRQFFQFYGYILNNEVLPVIQYCDVTTRPHDAEDQHSAGWRHKTDACDVIVSLQGSTETCLYIHPWCLQHSVSHCASSKEFLFLKFSCSCISLVCDVSEMVFCFCFLKHTVPSDGLNTWQK